MDNIFGDSCIFVIKFSLALELSNLFVQVYVKVALGPIAYIIHFNLIYTCSYTPFAHWKMCVLMGSWEPLFFFLNYKWTLSQIKF